MAFFTVFGMSVKLEVQEYLMASLLYISDYFRSLRKNSSIPIFMKGFFSVNLSRNSNVFFRAVKVARYYNVFSHQMAPPIISSSDSILYFFIASGRESTMSLHA